MNTKFLFLYKYARFFPSYVSFCCPTNNIPIPTMLSFALFPLQLMLIIVSAVIVILSQCCGGGNKKPKKTVPRTKQGKAIVVGKNTAGGKPAKVIAGRKPPVAGVTEKKLPSAKPIDMKQPSPAKVVAGNKKTPVSKAQRIGKNDNKLEASGKQKSGIMDSGMISKSPPKVKTPAALQQPQMKAHKIAIASDQDFQKLPGMAPFQLPLTSNKRAVPPPPPPTPPMKPQFASPMKPQYASKADPNYHTLSDLDVKIFDMKSPSPAPRGGATPPKFAIANDKDYTTLGPLDANIFIKDNPSGRANKAPTPAGAPPKFAAATDPNYTTLGALDANVFVNNPPARANTPAGTPPRFATATDPNYHTLGALDANIFVNKPPARANASAPRSVAAANTEQDYEALPKEDLYDFSS